MVNKNFTFFNQFEVEEAIPYRASRCVCCGEASVEDMVKMLIPSDRGGRWAHKRCLNKCFSDKLEVVGSNSKRCINHTIEAIISLEDMKGGITAYVRRKEVLSAIKMNNAQTRKVVSPLFTSNQASDEYFKTLACRAYHIYINGVEVHSYEEYKKLTDRLY